ncbi:YfhO family protein [Pseudalkalibacillus decolorationis]|uniref:YfhO family protein n=1 Tax=Pseudalkalibacillus decolorationis TaxID=163879 RepID=UPI0021489EBD|nr:YfhO family protein [Pseudalkalibacillus decolorationis]
MRKKHNLSILLFCSVVLAVLAHLFFLKEWTQDHYMVGPNDGLQQMVTFKKLLYEQYTKGNLFYSYQFGLGGGTYSQLAFYFSTSFIFILTSAVVFLFQSVHLLGAADIIFWAKAAVFISIGRLTLIIFMTTIVFRYMKSNWLAAFTGASVYGLSVMYFRHVTYWEFFADAMLWIPLLVFGVEKIIREARFGWLIVAVAMTLFDNFYFAYINLIFIVIYIVFRLLIQLEENETSRWRQFKLYVTSGLIGFGISAVSFIPAVYGFLNNHRPPYNKPIPIFHSDNILFTSPYIIVPTLFLLFLFTFSFYKLPTFKLFTSMSIFFILLHFSPMVASAFNGFSAPQYRWEYLLSFTIGGAVATGLTHLNRIYKKEIVVSSLWVITTYLAFCLLDQTLSITSLPSILIFILVFATLTLFFCFIWKQNKTWHVVLHGGVLLTFILFANVFQYAISGVGEVNQVSKGYLVSDKYNGKEQRQLLKQIKNRESNPFYRIDWKVGRLNNTPIVQDFNGMSAYSSILNQNLLFFYLHDLNIDMGRESVSRYATLGKRANLYSLFQGKYMMTEKKHTANIPYGFKKILESKNYVVYQNSNLLPFVRMTDHVFTEKEMENSSILEKEHAMLKGVIVPNTHTSNGEIPNVPNILNETTIETAGASFKNNKLTVTKSKGGINLVINEPKLDTKDYYVSFHLENLAIDQGFTLRVNDYRTSRKSNQSIYKTYVDDLTIRVPKADKIKIRLPKGKYILKDLALYEENYRTLKMVKKNATQTARINWIHNKLTITYNNQSKNRYMMLPIPFEKGWEVTINNEKQSIEKVNYAFLGFPIKEGINEIKLVYYPPYFRISLALTIISSVLALVLLWRYPRRSRRGR